MRVPFLLIFTLIHCSIAAPALGIPQETRDALERTESLTPLERQLIENFIDSTALAARLEAEAETKRKTALESFRGLNLGAAFGWFVYDDDTIAKAEVIGGVLRVTERENQDLKYLLEAHFFPKLAREGLVGVGPFFAVAADDEDVIDALSAGIMIGFRRDKESTASLNFGIGLYMDTNAQVLGGGMREGQPLPTGETEIRFEEKGKTGVNLLFSFAW